MTDDLELYMLEKELSVVGLGKLGSCMAASFANFGYSVHGSDLNEAIVEEIDEGSAPYPEPHLQDYIKNADNDLNVTTDTFEAIENTDVTFIVVNTPSTPDGKYSLAQVEEVCGTVGEVIRDKNDYHLVVLTSTVFPGSTNSEVRRAIEESSGKEAGEEFGLCYSPEFIAIGNIIEGLENPDFFLIGEHTEKAGEILSEIYSEWGANSTPIVRVTPKEAEIAKMAVNSYVTMKISYANTLGQICHQFDANVDAVTDVLSSDGRISGNYLTAGSRFGGPCFPRDNRAFSRLAEEANTEPPLARATDEVNQIHTHWLANVVRRETQGDKVGILGLTYKPGTYIVEESQGMELANVLSDEYDLICYDPGGLGQARSEFSGAEYTDYVEYALDVDTAVVTVQWEEFMDYSIYEGKELTLIDTWRTLDEDKLPEEIEYIGIGNDS